MTNKFKWVHIVLQTVIIILLAIVVIQVANISSSLKNDSVSVNDNAAKTVSTPYGELDFPQQYYDDVKIEESNENGVFSQTFYATITEEPVELYTVYFGQTDTGFDAGYILTDNGEKVPVRLHLTDFESEEKFTEDEEYNLLVLQETVNELLKSIKSLENYVVA